MYVREMFSTINLLFLFSLGFTSWFILCYFKQIENHFMENQIKPSQDSNPIIDKVKTITEKEEDLSPMPTACHDTSEIYINFLCIFVCIYVLIKITLMAEDYITKYIRAKCYQDDKNFIHQDSLEDIREQQSNLLMKMKSLEKQNNRLKQILKPETKEVTMKKTEEPNLENNTNKSLQNIFISNRHIHLNRQVFVKEKNFTVCFDDKCSKADQLWNKYLELREIITTKNSFNLNKEEAAFTPVVISTEELKTKKGLF